MERFTSPHEMEAAAADRLASALAEAVGARGRAAFAGAGGSTPAPIYARMSAADLPWDRVTVTLIDERWVPRDHPDSNAGLLRDALLQDRAAAARFIPLQRGGATPDIDAAEAARDLADLPAPLDAAFLGMGEDGHFASLFPGSPALSAGLAPDAPLCLPVPAGAGRPPPQPRLTLPLHAIADARVLLLGARGHAKRELLERTLAGEGGDLPVAHLLRRAPHLQILWSPETPQ